MFKKSPRFQSKSPVQSSPGNTLCPKFLRQILKCVITKSWKYQMNEEKPNRKKKTQMKDERHIPLPHFRVKERFT